MAKYLNADYWRNAYLLEFKLNGVLTDAFAFSVPPESEEFVFPQRKAETKTFGGAVVADYGNDLVQINLSGSTINQESKLIYKSRLGNTEMTGEQEIFYLRDLLKKYGARENLDGKEVYLYSLNGGNKTKHNPKWWKIYVADLTISRNKDKPFCYNYKFSAIGEPEVVAKKILTKFNETIESWKNAIDEVLQAMNDQAAILEDYGVGVLNEISDGINTFTQCIDAFNGSCSRYINLIEGTLVAATDLAVDTIGLGDKILYTATRYYPTIVSDVWNTCLDCWDAAKNIYTYCTGIGEEYFSESAWQNIKELFSDDVSDEDIVDLYSTVANTNLSLADKAVTLTSRCLNDIGVAVNPGSADKDDEIIITHGYKVVSASDAETSWDQIAKDYYGDATLSYIIATFNNLPSDEPLKAGQSISIPQLNSAENRITNNEIYNTPDVKDNYGKDLIIKNNDFAIYNGDLAVIGGIENLNQSLLNRYSTLVGARIRVEAYGIQASIGDALNATSALIQASVHQTTVEDPRVESVEDINFEGVGDELTVAVIYVDKNGIKRNFGGTI